jgi:hypothetical protein
LYPLASNVGIQNDKGAYPAMDTIDTCYIAAVSAGGWLNTGLAAKEKRLTQFQVKRFDYDRAAIN